MGLGSGIRDLGSEIRDPEKNLFRITDSGVKKGTGSQIRIRNLGPYISMLMAGCFVYKEDFGLGFVSSWIRIKIEMLGCFVWA